MPLDVLPRVNASGEQDFNEFILHTEEYISYNNNTRDRNKYLSLKGSLKEGRGVSFYGLRTFSVMVQS